MEDAPIDLDPLIARVRASLERHALGPPGAYRRFTIGDRAGAAPDPYGCADAANLLFTLSQLPRAPEERAGFVAELRALQDPDSGLFREDTHHPFHTTAHCLAALELFDAGAERPLRALDALAEPGAVAPFLDSLDWAGAPWTESHRGAGLYSALFLVDRIGRAWEDAFFGWLSRETDPETGLVRMGCARPVDAHVFPHLAGSFHYLFCAENARRPWRLPERLVDTCLRIEADRLFPLSSFVGFAEIDWVYCLTRGVRQSGHRFLEAKAALVRFARVHFEFLMGLPDDDPGLDDLHALFGTLCTFAELQSALPGLVVSARPLRLVLDRRPFI